MISTNDLRHTIRTALARQGLRPAPARVPLQNPGLSAPPREPDWAVREIVEDLMFEPAIQR